ncbi:MAG: class I SAM-dependent methyltransferase [Bacteroidetes bacterium]|nr:class I SAM-dependent methyltransferase [Bacteroidota bacterium]
MNAPDVQGRALMDYWLKKEKKINLRLHTSYGPSERMPVSVFFRDPRKYSELERQALSYCKGRVLDVGAGAGAFPLVLQEKGFSVTALENSPLSCEVMRLRGVKDILMADLWELEGSQWDTLLLMMNGLGLAGTLPDLPSLLLQLQTLMAPDGQILFDSSDISYLYDGGVPVPEDRYWGEIDYQYEYKGERGDKFSWLYIEQELISVIARDMGFRYQLLYGPENDQYLGRLMLT